MGVGRLVEIGYLEREYVNCPLEGRYSYNGGAGWKWLQKLLFWVLGRIGCRAVERREFVKKVSFDPEDIENSLHGQLNEVAASYGVRPSCVLMGFNEFSDMLGRYGNNRREDFGRSLESPVMLQDTMKILGVDVVIIPWMSGVLFLSQEMQKLAIERYL